MKPGFKIPVLRCGRPSQIFPPLNAVLPIACLSLGLFSVGPVGQALAGEEAGPAGEAVANTQSVHSDPLDGVVSSWIYFSDKGPEAGQYQPPGSELDPQSGARGDRARLTRRWQDAPVAESYIARVRASGAIIRSVSRWLNAVSVSATRAELDALAMAPFVRRTSPVLQLVRRPEPDIPRQVDLHPEAAEPPGQTTGELGATSSVVSDEVRFHGVAWYELDQIGVTALQRLGYTGAGVRVALFDTGFKLDHRALRGRNVVAQRDFVFHRDRVYDDLHDDPATWQHGTATWSILGGHDPGNFVGGASEAEFVLCEVADLRGTYPGQEDYYVAALEYADSLGVRLVSASLGYDFFNGIVGYTPRQHDGNTAAVTRAVDIAASRGMAIVNAAGNSGPWPMSIGCPADADSVISVGAVDSLGLVTEFSSRGPTADGRIKPEVMARGIESSVADSGTDGYRRWAGTSFAAPTVAAAAALLLEAHPDWNGARLRQALMATGNAASHPDNNYGYGLVRAAAALHDDPVIAPPVLPPPFALLRPTPGDTLDRSSVTLLWQRSWSPVASLPIHYAVLVDRAPAFAAPLRFEVADTLLQIPGESLVPGARYYWKVVALNESGRERECYFAATFTVRASAVDAPAAADRIGGPHLRFSPNPSGGGTLIALQGFAATRGMAGEIGRVDIFDVAGRVVRHLEVGAVTGGSSPVQAWWDGTDDRGQVVPSGVYLCVATAGGVTARSKVTVRR